MRWASTHSSLLSTAFAAEETARAAQQALGDGPVDLVLAFYSSHHVREAAELADVMRRLLAPKCLAGVSAHGVISSEHEVEGEPALSVLAARLPGVTASPFVMLQQGWQEAAGDAEAFARSAPAVADSELVIVMADPFTLDVERVLGAFNHHAPRARVVGGMASAGPKPGSNALILNDWIAHEGGLGLALSGALRVDVIVSQGCRPVGPPLEVTRSEGNLLVELDGKPALERAEQVLRALPEDHQHRLKNGLYIGRPARPGASGQGDYLIRNLLGADRDRGVLAVGDRVDTSEHIRLHVRDASTAREDLEMLLSPQGFDTRAAAAVLFACNGRGRGLYGEPDGDIATLQSALGGRVPIAGMFCAGEIGPVGGRNFMHGHTASIAIVRGPAKHDS
jgi:small ligand-binding sensory domain FIST